MGALDSKTVIVTGAARGLGQAMSRGLIAAGATVVGVDLPGEVELDRTAKALGGKFLPCHANVAEEADCARVVAHALETAGGLHVLINNAGMGMQVINTFNSSDPTPFWKLRPDQWHDMLGNNATSQFLMARACVPHLIAQGWGRIINVTTSLATMLLRGFTPYGPSKAAAEAHSVIMASDLEGTGVTVNVLVPGGAANTRMISDFKRYPDRAALVQPVKMVAPAVWIASNQSDGVTGRRFIAKNWDESLTPAEAALAACAPAGWRTNG
ncbi:MAG: SDR family oxidoreductase [Betaproteobacteria bacterium]|nr:SDR family oxidoreductase [Betaproteobacteria bacterium]